MDELRAETKTKKTAQFEAAGKFDDKEELDNLISKKLKADYTGYKDIQSKLSLQGNEAYKELLRDIYVAGQGAEGL